MPSVILEDGVVLCRLLRLVVKSHNDAAVQIGDFEAVVDIPSHDALDVETEGTGTHVIQSGRG